MSQVTLKDFEIRYINIRKAYPEVKDCTVSGCQNPRDSTEGLGEGTCCAYHRLLFDFWGMDTLTTMQVAHYFGNKEARRKAFADWLNKTGKEECDRIVLKMAEEPINWKC